MPLKGTRFQFRCHKEIQCFTKCCADLKLVLTPYDIIRMKNRLSMSSDDFLDQYTETEIKPNKRFPQVFLKMNPDHRGKKCPFVTPTGCEIYEDRPGACRIYPLGRAALKIDEQHHTKEKYFIVKEHHCFGFIEKKRWSVSQWMKNEGLDEYNKMNDMWLEIVSSTADLGPKEQVSKKMQMFFMASYNIDRFKNFLFHSHFFNRFHVDPAVKEKISSNDVELMKFSFDWLKFSLFGQSTMQIKAPYS